MKSSLMTPTIVCVAPLSCTVRPMTAGVAAEPTLPQRMAENHAVRVVRLVPSSSVNARPSTGRSSERAEELGRHAEPGDALRLLDAGDVHVPPREPRDVLERARLRIQSTRFAGAI